MGHASGRLDAHLNNRFPGGRRGRRENHPPRFAWTTGDAERPPQARHRVCPAPGAGGGLGSGRLLGRGREPARRSVPGLPRALGAVSGVKQRTSASPSEGGCDCSDRCQGSGDLGEIGAQGLLGVGGGRPWPTSSGCKGTEHQRTSEGMEMTRVSIVLAAP